MERFYLIAPALFLAAAMMGAFVVYCGLYAVGRPPRLTGVKHNQLLGPFMAGYLVWLIGPVERLLVGRVSPNFITAISLGFCVATGVAAASGHLAWAVWLYVAGGILDVLDGRIARLDGKQTKSGALFDSVSDRWGELFVFLGYAWYLHETPWLLAVIGAFGASMMVSYTRARAEGLGISLSGGLMQRAERILLVTGGTLIAAWYGAPSAAPILGSTMLICTLASSATAVNRWVVAFRELKDIEAREVAPPVVLDEPEVMPVPARLKSLSNPELPRVRPLEQH
jgi:CDP-diacylglycerol---glycerol-3-phosphate 3-phosphatidyltransferase